MDPTFTVRIGDEQPHLTSIEVRMSSSFYMPTRVVSGIGSLASLASLAKGLGMTSVLVVSDPVISQQRYYSKAVDSLEEAGLRVSRFERCEIDARVSQIDSEAERLQREGVDGLVCIGGGSVMCAGKGMAIAAANGKSIRACTGVGNFTRRALRMIMVPTTAGSGSEVSQWTVIKDEENHAKLVCGGPLSFPDIAVLDPVVLASLPTRIAAATGVDALTHALEAYTSSMASAITDAIAVEAIRLQMTSLRGSACADNDVEARNANLIASTMANMACGNARLGHAHALSLPLESLVDMPHPLGVGVLMPHVLAFNLMVLPQKAIRVADALGVRDSGSLSHGDAITASVAALRQLYDDIGFPQRWSENQLPRNRLRQMSERAVPGLYAGSDGIGIGVSINDDTLIASPAPRKMTVQQAESVYAACIL